MLDVLNLHSLLGFTSDTQALWCVVILVAFIGSIYAIWGGLSSCAISDTLNGIGLLTGGFLITYFAIYTLGGTPMKPETSLPEPEVSPTALHLSQRGGKCRPPELHRLE